MTRLGLQINNFSYGASGQGDVADLFPTVVAQAQEADASGFDSVFVMDHFYQLPGIGTPDQPMLEAYTALGALASVTERVQLGTLVTGNTYRNPTLLAKNITTLDVISQGRAILGIGTGWFELEHDQLGYEFGTFTDRFEEAMANPRVRDHIPLMIGGSGEKKTIPLAARHFDHLNVIAGFDELAKKVEVVKQRCEAIDRDPATLETSMLVGAVVGEGISPDLIPDDFKQRMVAGSVEQIAEQIQTKVLDAGIDGVILFVPTQTVGYQPGQISALGEALKPLVGG